MNEDKKLDILRFFLTACLICLEYWAMQPYHEPTLARIWQVLMIFCRKMAYAFGRAALNAEHNYYIAVEAGL